MTLMQLYSYLVKTTGMLKGSDKGSFYNENFLRGLPHLSKTMKRTGGVKIVDDAKLDAKINHEPNLWAISEEHPLPEHVDRDSLNYTVLQAINACILNEGPRARMPILQDVISRHPRRQESGAHAATVDSQEPSASPSPATKPAVPLSNVGLPLDVAATMRSQSSVNHASISPPISSSAAAISAAFQPGSNGRNQLESLLGRLHEQGQSQQPVNNQYNALNQHLAFIQQQQQRQQFQHQHQVQALWNNATLKDVITALSSQQQQNHNFAPHMSNNQGFNAAIGIHHQLSASSTTPAINSGFVGLAGTAMSLTNHMSQQQVGHTNNSPQPGPQAPQMHELRDVLNGLVANYQNQSSAAPPQQIHYGLQPPVPHHAQLDGARSSNRSFPNMSPSDLQQLVAQAIVLGAQFGADSVLNQNGSSSDTNGNRDDSSNTT